jgi:hypothetical protein
MEASGEPAGIPRRSGGDLSPGIERELEALRQAGFETLPGGGFHGIATSKGDPVYIGIGTLVLAILIVILLVILL